MAVDPRNHCYCKDRCGDPCYSKDGCKVLAAAKTEMGSLILQGFKTGDWILATVRIAEEALLLKTGGLIIATVRIAEDSGLLKGLLILATVRTFDPCYSKTGGLILATGRIAEESLLLEGLLILANVRTVDPCYSKIGGLILATGRIADWTLGTPRVVDRFLLLQEVLARTDSRVSS
ncbi:hypothetical protein ACLKA7_000685 [Drosophila subpalustris]